MLVPALVTKKSERQVGKFTEMQNPIHKTLITFLQNEVASASATPFAFFQLKFLAWLVAVMVTAYFFCCSSEQICWLHQYNPWQHRQELMQLRYTWTEACQIALYRGDPFASQRSLAESSDPERLSFPPLELAGPHVTPACSAYLMLLNQDNLDMLSSWIT